MNEPTWLTIGRELQAIAQTGLHFSKDPFDLQRFGRVQELATAIMADVSGDDPGTLLSLFKQGEGYATPKVDVRGAAFRDGRILMVREISDGLWTLPGGWADVNQTAAQCVVREIFEESGFEARALKLAAVHDKQKRSVSVRVPFSIYKMFFLCEITGGAARASNETSEVAFFERDGLPPLSLGRATAEQIDLMFTHRDDRARATDFD
ncbi:MAG: NUDIX hydrolase [Gammaproteobacteria bacterium]